jgi:hypothetical protein
VPVLMTNAPLVICINPMQIKKGYSRFSLFDLRGSIPNMLATYSLLPQRKRIPSRRTGNASASKPPTRRCLCRSGR